MRLRNLLVLILAMIIFTGCGAKETAKVEAVKKVKVETAGVSKIVISDEYSGEINPAEQTDVTPKISGKVKKINVEIGDKVKIGDVLFTLDSTDIENQLRQAQAGVEAARANLNRTQGSGLQQSLVQAQSAYDQAKIGFDDTKNNYEKAKALFDIQGISKTELDGAESRMLISKEQFETAEKNLNLIKNGIGPDSIEAAQAALKQAQAAEAMALTQLKDSKVTAPIGGIVSKKNIAIGEGVSPAVAAIQISNTDKLITEINVPQNVINKLSIDQEIELSVDALQGKAYKGKIVNINSVAEEKSHNYTVKIELIDKSLDLKAGMFAKIKIITDEINGVAVPNIAIVSENSLQYMYLVEDNKIVKKIVKVGVSNDKITQILDGVKQGDQFLTEGQNFVSDGEPVEIVK